MSVFPLNSTSFFSGVKVFDELGNLYSIGIDGTIEQLTFECEVRSVSRSLILMRDGSIYHPDYCDRKIVRVEDFLLDNGKSPHQILNIKISHFSESFYIDENGHKWVVGSLIDTEDGTFSRFLEEPIYGQNCVQTQFNNHFGLNENGEIFYKFCPCLGSSKEMTIRKLPLSFRIRSILRSGSQLCVIDEYGDTYLIDIKCDCTNLDPKRALTGDNIGENHTIYKLPFTNVDKMVCRGPLQFTILDKDGKLTVNYLTESGLQDSSIICPINEKIKDFSFYGPDNIFITTWKGIYGWNYKTQQPKLLSCKEFTFHQ